MISDDGMSPGQGQEPELILAEEQSVIHKIGFIKETQGTLILTNKKLVFVGTDQEVGFRMSPIITRGSMAHFRFSDIDDLKNIPVNPSNLSIPLNEIELETGVEHTFEISRMNTR